MVSHGQGICELAETESWGSSDEGPVSKLPHMVSDRIYNSWVLITQSCPPLCDPMDCSPEDSSVRGISQARRVEWVAIPFTRRFAWPRDWTLVSHTAGRFFTIWAPREALIKVDWGPQLLSVTWSLSSVSWYLVLSNMLASSKPIRKKRITESIIKKKISHYFVTRS